MKTALLFTAILTTLLVGNCQAAVIAYWNFNELSITTASAPGSGGVPTSLAATVGSGTLNLAGWGGTVDDFGGSTLNALNSDTSGASLSLVLGTSGNGTHVQFSTSLAGYENPVITFATRGTSTGFDTGTWSYSLNGTDFTTLPSVNTASRATDFALVTADFSALDALDNASSVIFRYTLSGATSASGNNRIDNLQINATEISAAPEPSRAILLVFASGFLVLRRRRSLRQPVQK